MLYPLSYGRSCFGPLETPAEAEIFGVALRSYAARLGFLQPVGEPVLLRERDRFILAAETEPHLALRVRRTDPAHQRVGELGARLEFDHPILGVGPPRLHGGLGRLVDRDLGHGGSLAGRGPGRLDDC